MNARGLLVACACAAAIAVTAAAGLAAQGSRATTYATVLNERDQPVRGLQSADLVLRDGGVRQGIVDAQPAIEPLAVALVIDGFDAAALTSIRPAVDDAVRKLRTANPATQIGLVGAEPNVVMFGGDATAWAAAVDATATTPAAPSVVDAIIKASQALAAAPPDRRTVIAIVKAGGAKTIERPERLVTSVAAGRVALWTVELGAPGVAPWPTAMNAALGEATRQGGALRQPSTSLDQVKAHLAVVVDCLLSQYLVTYNWPDPMLSTFSLVTRHDAGRVLTPSWSR